MKTSDKKIIHSAFVMTRICLFSYIILVQLWTALRLDKSEWNSLQLIQKLVTEILGLVWMQYEWKCTCVWAVEEKAERGWKDWYVLVTKGTASTCKTGECVVCVTARKAAHWGDHSTGDQHWKISIAWQQGCRISHMPFSFLLAWKENKHIFQNTS